MHDQVFISRDLRSENERSPVPSSHHKRCEDPIGTKLTSHVVAPENDFTTTLLDLESFHPPTFCTMLLPQTTVTGLFPHWQNGSLLLRLLLLYIVFKLLLALAEFAGWRNFDDLVGFFCFVPLGLFFHRLP